MDFKEKILCRVYLSNTPTPQKRTSFLSHNAAKLPTIDVDPLSAGDRYLYETDESLGKTRHALAKFGDSIQFNLYKTMTNSYPHRLSFITEELLARARETLEDDPY